VRVDRFAEDVLQQERELTHDESGFARSMGSLPSDLESQVDGARHAAAISAIETTGLSFDRDYITAELRYERTLIHLIEDEMLPSARAPELRRFLETLHAKTARRISAAEEIESKIP
jgi:predicted outer membrane protein